MNEDLKGSPLCRRLRPRRRDVIVPLCIWVPFVLLLAAGIFVMAYEDFKAGNTGDEAVHVILGTIVVGLIAFFAVSEIKQKRRMNIKKAERLADLTQETLMALEEEISRSEMKYKSFYLLREYFYAPKARLLLRYENIAGWQTIRHSSYGLQDGAWVNITEPDGFTQKVNIRQWRLYLQELDELVQELNARKGQAINRTESRKNETL